MFKRVYVPIDNSDISEIKYCKKQLTLVKATKAESRISHVVNLEQNYFWD